MYLTLWLMCKKALGQELHWVDACFCSVRGGLFSNDRSGSVRGLLLMRRCGAGELSMVLLVVCVHFLPNKQRGLPIYSKFQVIESKIESSIFARRRPKNKNWGGGPKSRRRPSVRCPPRILPGYVYFCQLHIMQRYKIIVCGLDIFGLASLKLCR